MIAEVIANTGWTWDEALDGLTMPRYRALVAEWRARPPAHWLIAAALHYRPREIDAPAETHAPTVAALRAAFPGGKL